MIEVKKYYTIKDNLKHTPLVCPENDNLVNDIVYRFSSNGCFGDRYFIAKYLPWVWRSLFIPDILKRQKHSIQFESFINHLLINDSVNQDDHDVFIECRDAVIHTEITAYETDINNQSISITITIYVNDESDVIHHSCDTFEKRIKLYKKFTNETLDHIPTESIRMY